MRASKLSGSAPESQGAEAGGGARVVVVGPASQLLVG